MTTEEKKSILVRAAQKIKSFGYKAYICQGKTSPDLMWGVYTDGKTIGGFNIDGFGFLSVSTKHHPGCGVGTGIQVRGDLLADEITEDICRQGLNMCPDWYRGSLKGVRKYTPEEYFRIESETWHNEYEEI